MGMVASLVGMGVVVSFMGVGVVVSFMGMGVVVVCIHAHLSSSPICCPSLFLIHPPFAIRPHSSSIPHSSSVPHLSFVVVMVCHHFNVQADHCPPLMATSSSAPLIPPYKQWLVGWLVVLCGMAAEGVELLLPHRSRTHCCLAS